MRNEGKLSNGLLQRLDTTTRIQVALRLLVVGVFVLAGVMKCFSFAQFQATIYASRLVPIDLVPLVARLVIAAEWASLALFAPLPKVCNLAVRGVVLLCCTFISYSLWRAWQGIAVPCNCFGLLFKLTPLESILLNCVLLGLLLRSLPVQNGDEATRRLKSKERPVAA